MKRLVTLTSVLALALSPVGAPSVATAAGKQYHKFCDHGITSAEDFASKLSKSLAADHTGRTRMAGCWATPVMVVAAFQDAAPEEGVTLANVVEFVRHGLVEQALTSSVTFYTSCVKGRTTGPEDVKMDCEEQTLTPPHRVLVSRKTGKNLVKMECANVGFTPIIRVACASILFETRRAAEKVAHVPLYGASLQSDRCHGYRKVEVARSGTVTPTTLPRDFAPGCIERRLGCSYNETDDAAPAPRFADKTMVGLSPGTWEIIVDPDLVPDQRRALGICLEVVDPRTGEMVGTSSQTALVLSANYHRVGKSRVANVYYFYGEQPANERDDPQKALYFYR